MPRVIIMRDAVIAAAVAFAPVVFVIVMLLAVGK
jgi:hypothetical protein